MKSVWVCSVSLSGQLSDVTCKPRACGNNRKGHCGTLDAPCDAVKYAPMKKGKWEYNGNKDEIECSICKEAHFIGATKYCPSCGAVMDEKG